MNEQQQHQLQFSIDSQSSSIKKGRGGNKQTAWSRLEDRQLCRTWIAVLREVDEGGPNSTVADTMWEGIHQHFTEQMKGIDVAVKVERSAQALKNRWGIISRAVAVFIECYNEVLQKYRNGWVNEDVLEEEAELLYIKKFEGNNEKAKVVIDFDFTHCWKILRNSEKWKDVYNCSEPPRQPNQQTGESRMIDNTSSTSFSRPESPPRSTASAAAAAAGAALNSPPTSTQKRTLEYYLETLVKRQRTENELWKRVSKTITESNVLAEAKNDFKTMTIRWEQFPENDPRRLYFQMRQKEIFDQSRASANGKHTHNKDGGANSTHVLSEEAENQ